MQQPDLLDALVQTKRLGNLLIEIFDLTTQLAEAVDREDQVSIQMLLAMRREPIDKLDLANGALKKKQQSLPEEDAQQLASLLNGGPAGSPGEDKLVEQVAANHRLLERLVALDQNVNRKLTRDKSVYTNGQTQKKG